MRHVFKAGQVGTTKGLMSQEILRGSMVDAWCIETDCIDVPLRGQKDVLVREFLGRFGAPNPVTFEVFSDSVLRRANELSFGYRQLPTFDLARSNYVLSLGADFLGTWNSPVAQNVGYGEMRQGRARPRTVAEHRGSRPASEMTLLLCRAAHKTRVISVER